MNRILSILMWVIAGFFTAAFIAIVFISVGFGMIAAGCGWMADQATLRAKIFAKGHYR